MKRGKKGHEIDDEDMKVLMAIEDLKKKRNTRFIAYTDIITLMKELGWQPPKQLK